MGGTNLNTQSQAALNPSQTEVMRRRRRFLEGDKVIQIRNNYEKEIFNGDIGRIKTMDLEIQEVTMDFDSCEVANEFSDLDEIIPANAISVHKSQGSEYLAVVMMLSGTGYSAEQARALFTVTELRGSQAPLGLVEIHEVSAGPFNPFLWERNQLHWVVEVRMPLHAPRLGGVFRNIYAPSVVEEGQGRRFFYNAWDSIESGNDQVYCSITPDFIDFYDRHVIVHNTDT